MTNRLKSTTILLGLMATGAWADTNTQSPKIVVGILVDQLRTDYIEQFLPYFGEKGFNRLMTEGVYMPDVDFHSTVSDAPTGAAVVYTGAWPAVNSIAGAEVADQATRRNIPVTADPSKTKMEYSPERLKVSTLSDEYMLGGGVLSKSYSIAGDPQVAVIMAGHEGNGAIWFDETLGRWNTPTYYGSLPASIGNRNRTEPLSAKITTTVWRPSVETLKAIATGVNNGANFSYTFSGGNRDSYSKYKVSAPFNSDVTDGAIELLKTIRTSGGGMLNIGYSLAPYPYDFDGDNRPELADSYIKLDGDLERLLDTIEQEYGLENAIIFLSSTGYALEPETAERPSRIPTGEITLRQAESLLNSYLSATYGNGDYVALIKNGKLYLDGKEIARKGLGLKEMRRETKDFLLKMAGVSEVYTIDEILHSDNARTREIAMGVDPKNAPDLFLYFQPGWTVTDDNAFPAKSEKVRLATPLTPAFLLAPDTEPSKVESSVDATALAPTIASAIHIRAPNAAAVRPLPLSKKQKK